MTEKAQAQAEAQAQEGGASSRRSNVGRLDHEKMQVFRDALELYALVDGLRKRLTRIRRFEVDQLRRASLSILLNTAEGSGESAPLEKARFHRIARRSATECAAVFHAIAVVEPQHAPLCRKGRNLVVQITAQLTGLCRAMEQRAADKPR